jgi:hypothetical protein
LPKVSAHRWAMFGFFRFTPEATQATWSSLSAQFGTSSHRRNQAVKTFGLSARLYFGACGICTTRTLGSKSMCVIPSLSGLSASNKPAVTSSTLYRNRSAIVTMLVSRTRPGSDVRGGPTRHVSHTSLAIGESDDHHLSSHIRGSINQAM